MIDTREDFVRHAMMQRTNEVEDVCAGFMTNGIAASRIQLGHLRSDLSTTRVLVDGIVRAEIRQTIEVKNGKLSCRTETRRFP